MRFRWWALSAVFLACGCGPSFHPQNEKELGDALRKGTGTVILPPGTMEITRELLVASGRDIEIRGSSSGSTLRLSENFQGRAALVFEHGSGISLKGFRIDGRRETLAQPIGLPPSNVPFARYYRNNGILAEDVRKLDILNVALANVANYAILVSKCSRVRMRNLLVSDCGSTKPGGRNNASGGILFEEGTNGFEVQNCTLQRILGNAIWTHSNYGSPRNAGGSINANFITEVARDAIQIGHATGMRVLANRASRIGYPVERVDMEGYGIPVALDTAGDVDRTVYRGNYFEDINGQCIDLDGFHAGEVRENRCVSPRPASEYPYEHYGIVMGNTNPDM
ncbi:MAG: right-handed parallel beta-helix repeat-containing protein, partial [Acidobacteria bacterium]|nr:right-handed parallel beta-helix repeat-containing protein [Acidobacteriota bacterium]